jgi:hypothetical protein
MKTSLTIPDGVYRAVKQRAAASGRTIGDIVEQGLREWLAREDAPACAYRLELPIMKGMRRPNANVDDRNELIEFMDGRA